MKLKIQKLILWISFVTLSFSASVSNFTFNKDNDDIYRISFAIDELTVDNVGEYSRIISKSDGYTEVVGLPELPTYTSMLMVDPDAEYEIKS